MFEEPNEEMAYFRYTVISPLLSDDGRLRKTRIEELLDASLRPCTAV